MKKDISAVARCLLSMQRMSWEHGVAAQAFFECGDTQMGMLLVNEALHRNDGKGLIGITNPAMDTVDCGANGLPAYYAYLHSKEKRYLKAARDLADWLHLSAPRAESGQFYHNPSGRFHLIDGIYHIVPVLVVTDHVDFAMEQIQLFHDRHYDPHTGLYRHLWDQDTLSFGRRGFWGGGQGWMAGALALACQFLPESHNKYRKQLTEMLENLINSVQPYFRDDYLLHDMMDDTTTFAEVTAPLMICYAIYVGIRASVLSPDLRDLADKILLHVESHIDEDGLVRDACSSPTFDRIGRSAEAQAFFMLCCAASSV